MEIKLTLSLPRDEISIPVVRRVRTQAMRALGVLDRCTHDIEIALTEACANVLQTRRTATSMRCPRGSTTRWRSSR